MKYVLPLPETPAVHALTDCDTSSFFFGIGKKSVLKTLKDSEGEFSDLDNLANFDQDIAVTCSKRFIARLYDQKKRYFSCHSDINKLRVKLTTSKRLPPSEAALREHILRASYQAKIWYGADVAKPPLPSPFEYGWRCFKDTLNPIYFVGNMSADVLQE